MLSWAVSADEHRRLVDDRQDGSQKRDTGKRENDFRRSQLRRKGFSEAAMPSDQSPVRHRL
ncbi:unnamed protein product [Protopolystoma xenopodis]|uniref:Uncharacterized protein n=1 Tax=Protopolystoma xenopodis TaxID=117903 RepID=A0A3S5AWF1_9PLAT|nr:unnamed protein product [Protopolystoma xenopodis]